MSITAETRRASHEDITSKAETRRNAILAVLPTEPGGMTAEELTDKLLRNGVIRRFDMNYARPRLTELKKVGAVVTVGKRRSYRTGKATAVWARPKEVVDADT